MSEYDDAHMLSKVLERMAAQAQHLKDKIDSGLEIPSWAEYKIYNAYSGLGSALGTAYPGEYEEKMAEADWSQYDVDDVHAAGRIAENHITDDPSELAKKIHAGLLKDPTHPKHAPSMVPIGVVGGGVLGAGLGYPLSFIPKMRYAPVVTGAAGALLSGLTGHKVTKDLRGAEGDRIHQEALATQKRRLANSALMSQLSRDVAEDYLRPMDELMDKESAAATFSKSMDKHPALKGKQSQLPDKIQSGIIKKRLRIKTAAAVATKTDPKKWEQAKAEARAKMGGKHSARAMQLATQIYKKKGGGYSGAKPTSKNNSLKKWTEQKWNWSGGDKPGPGGKGVYLPKKKAEGLKKSESGRKRLAAASRKKSEATRKGEQYSSHGLAKGTSLKAKK